MTKEPKPVVDPDNVEEILCNGPINLSFHGQGTHALAVLTLTQPRPDPVALFQGSVADKTVVRARIAMNIPNLIALRDLLAKHVKTESQISSASGGGSAVRH
jgi:hypothetical protein